MSPKPFVWLFAALGAAWVSAQSAQPLAGGSGTLYIGAWPNRIFVIDEATEQVSGTITMQVAGTAPGALRLSKDRKRFYVLNTNLEDLEVVDIAGRKSVDRFRLSEGRRRVRLVDLVPDPLDRYVIVMAKISEKREDHFAIAPNALLVYDLASHRVTRTIPWPDGDEQEGVGLVFSPDGKFLFVLAEDVQVLETTNFTKVDTWELSRPIESGFGRLDLGGNEQDYDEPEVATLFVRVSDAIQQRPLFGIARVNLTARSVDFFTLGPAVGRSRFAFALAPDGSHAYGLLQEIGRYEFWSFDLAGRRVTSRTEFAGRPRMSLHVSSNGKLLYVYGAGNTIDLHEAATYRYLRTITLDGDTTSPLRVLR